MKLKTTYGMGEDTCKRWCGGRTACIHLGEKLFPLPFLGSVVHLHFIFSLLFSKPVMTVSVPMLLCLWFPQTGNHLIRLGQPG